MDLTKLTPGSRITVFYDGEVRATRNVAMVKKLYLVDESGAKWNRATGRSWPRPHGAWRIEHAEPWKQEHSDALARANIITRLTTREAEKRMQHVDLNVLRTFMQALDAVRLEDDT